MTHAWESAILVLKEQRVDLLSLWGEEGTSVVRMVLRERTTGEMGIVKYTCSDGHFPSVGVHHPPAIRLERTITDLFGLIPDGASDTRPWLDHTLPYTFLPSLGHGLHQIPVGPVHAGIIEPGHFRFTVNGEAIVRLEARLGYVHKGIHSLFDGASFLRGAEIAECVSGDSVVAYATAFARAVENALGAQVSPRAHLLRGLMAEIERITNHLGDIGAICNDAAFALMLAQCSAWKERGLRAADACFGHRFMRGLIIPGGVIPQALGLDPRGPAVALLRTWMEGLRGILPRLMDLYDGTPSLQDRTVTTGFLRPEYALQFAAGGYVGRGSGRDFDARRDAPYAPYDTLVFSVPVREEGDVNARVWIRFLEIGYSLSLLDQILCALEGTQADISVVSLPDGETGQEGTSLVESFRGDIFAWVRLGEGGHILACHLRDPSWFQWPLLEVCVEGDIVADFPLCNKSFNCSYSGCDV